MATQLETQPQVQVAIDSRTTRLVSLYVGDIDKSVADAQLLDLFRQIGEVASLRICRDSTGMSLGYGYVNYRNRWNAERALEELNFIPLNGKPIRVMYSNRDPTARQSNNANIFIKNLDLEIDNSELYETFSTFGNILSCKVATDHSGQSKGYGYVQYVSAESARLAIEKLNGELLNGKRVYVGPLVRKEEREMAANRSTFTNVFVKNLSESVAEDDLKTIFGEFGSITSTVVMKKEDGTSKCFGFVNFENPNDAATAVETLDGKVFDGKAWFVGKALKKSEREVPSIFFFYKKKESYSSKRANTVYYFMNFGEFFDTNSCSGGARIAAEELSYNNNYNINNNGAITNMPSAAISQPRLVPQSLSNNKPVFNSSGLSLALQSNNMEVQGDIISRIGEDNYEASNNNNNAASVGGRRSRDAIEEHESRSGSDNMDNASGDDQDAEENQPRKKRYHRHTPQQIQELEALFKEFPHPDEKQRRELSRRLSLDPRQVKFWFQNRRTQMKTQIERHENTILRQENEKLRAENMSIREAMRNPMCSNCGGPAIMGEISLEEQHLRIENARLKDELDRVCSLAGKFLGRPVSSLGHPMPNSSLELGVGGGNVGAFGGGGLSVVPPNLPPNLGPNDNFAVGLSSPIAQTKAMMNSNVVVSPMERSMYLELALAAMDELVKIAQTDEPLWIKSYDRDVFNHEEYLRSFNPCIGLTPNGFVSEASRESGVVIINSLALVETLLDSGKWAEMFPCVVARTSTIDVISSGMGGTRNGALQLMQSELQVLSPLVPVREVKFLRFCKQHADGVWAVVDVSIDTVRDSSGGPVGLSCRRLPSGCVVQDMPNGYSKVTWVERAEYDESIVHELYRRLISSGLGFGAQRWVATLQRQCECLAILMSSSAPAKDHTAITAAGRKSMLKLAQRMTNNFCAGVCDSTVHKWSKLQSDNVDKDVRVMTRNSVDDPGEPPGVVLSAATSVWLPVVSHQRVFDFLRNEHLRSEWDILSNGGPMQEMAHIAKGQHHGNCVSLLRASAMNPNQSSMLILQETCTDASGSLVVYAPVDIPAMHVVMNGGDSAYVALLPSGFSIVPDGHGPSAQGGGGGGSLLTVAFQILVNSLPTAKLTVESIETVNNLISCTVQKIKGALGCEA